MPLHIYVHLDLEDFHFTLSLLIATTTEWDMSQAALQVTSGHANRAPCPSGHELRKSEAGRFSGFFLRGIICVSLICLCGSLGQFKDCS